MRISDWSSDVCSSDLQHQRRSADRWPIAAYVRGTACFRAANPKGSSSEAGANGFQIVDRVVSPPFLHELHQRLVPKRRDRLILHHEEGARRIGLNRGRSAEHTSELQSLMRISYAVFCLKNK